MADTPSHQPFALKYRPQAFDDVIGQPHVTTTLKNAITQKKIHHAYLFAGPRGVGKTSLARIFAKCINCETGPTLAPCQICPSCKEITAGSSLDVLEIDGASNTGVDDVRALRENVRYLPAHGRYRIYIIDEVHMLSQAAFNALLKTLEEPPAHVVFVFATTESHKIPATIVSRCHRFEFRRIPLPELRKQLEAIAAREGITVQEDALAGLARAAQGSLRDSESLLEQVAGFAQGEVTLAKVEELLGWAPEAMVTALLHAVVDRDPARSLGLIDRLYAEGRDLKQVADEMLEALRVSLIEPLPVLKTLGEPTLIRLFGLMYQEYSAIAKSPEPKTGLEVALVKMSQLPLLKEIEEAIGELKGGRTKVASPSPQPYPRRGEVPDEGRRGEGVEQGFEWNSWIKSLQAKRPQIAALLEHGTLLKTDDASIEIGFAKGSIHLQMLQSADKSALLADLLGQEFGKKVAVRLVESDTLAPKPPRSPLEAPEVLGAIEILGAKVKEVRNAS